MVAERASRRPQEFLTAPLTYVSAQLGHANPTTTLRHHARWMPKKGKRWVNALDKTARGGRFVEPKSGASEDEG
jgi:integrase